MGQSYEIYCKKCKKKCHAGRISCGTEFLIDPDKLKEFLFRHQGHDLVFLNDLEMDIDYLQYPELIGFEDEE